MLEVRRMVTSDVDDVERLLGRRMRNETAYRSVDYNIDKARAYLRNCHFGAIALLNNEPIGMFTGCVTPYFFGNDLIASEELWYVVPEHRSSSAALRLLRMFEDWARSYNVKEICIGLSSGADAERVGRFLMKKGYGHLGGLYKKPMVASQ